ncbi:MAG: 50S ribosomal protein L25/general stress protein Ctc [Gammaproteobacteria bacterium]|nr:50S ribosomal protein L25/general stress protein Ctc [Gammaproteobacteria bacterium]
MAEQYDIVAEPRTDFGKAAIRRLRRQGKVPAVIYGTGNEPKAVQIAENYLRKQLENEAIFAHILNVKVDGGSEQAVIKDLQRHPSTSRVMHMDFMRVSATQTISMQVPLHFEKEDEAPGVRQGGSVMHFITDVDIVCLPANLPEYLVVDMSALEIGDSVLLSQIPLPSGVEIPALAQDNDQPIAAVQAARASDDDVEASEDEGDAAGDAAAASDDDGGSEE